MHTMHNISPDMQQVLDEFALICKDYDILDDSMRFDLFASFMQVFNEIHFEQYEKNHFDRFQTARLIQALNTSSSIQVKCDGVNMKIDNAELLSSLKLFLHSLLEYNAMSLYEDLSIAEAKSIITDEEVFGFKFNNDRFKFKQPYTDEEIKNIIRYEKLKNDRTQKMLGNRSSEGKYKRIPEIGSYIELFLYYNPQLFGDYCNLDGEGFIKTKRQQFLLINRLMSLSGIYEEYLTESQVNNLEQSGDDEIVTNIKNWFNSFKTAEGAIFQELERSVKESEKKNLPNVAFITQDNTPLEVLMSGINPRQIALATAKEMYPKIPF